MRTIGKLCLGISVLSAVMLAQTVVQRVPAMNPPASEAPQGASIAVADPRPDTGTLDGQTYTNEYFALRYTLPEGMSPAEVGVEQRSDPAGNTFVLLVAHAQGTSLRTLVMMADRAQFYGGLADGNAYLRRINQSLSEQGFEIVRESAEYTYAGQKFFRADYRKGSVYRSEVFTVRSGYALGLRAAATTPEQVDELCESLNSLTFIGPERPAPRIPATPGLSPITGVIVGPPPQTNRGPSWTRGAEPGANCPQGSAGTPTRVRVSQGVAEGMVVSKVPPEYPLLARQARIQGQVRLHAVVGCDGRVRELRAISGHPMLLQAALNAVRKWRFKPYQLNGQAVEVETTVAVDFTLE